MKDRSEKLTLRDQFAIIVLPNILKSYGVGSSKIGEYAYSIADQMIESRKKSRETIKEELEEEKREKMRRMSQIMNRNHY